MHQALTFHCILLSFALALEYFFTEDIPSGVCESAPSGFWLEARDFTPLVPPPPSRLSRSGRSSPPSPNTPPLRRQHSHYDPPPQLSAPGPSRTKGMIKVMETMCSSYRIIYGTSSAITTNLVGWLLTILASYSSSPQPPPRPPKLRQISTDSVGSLIISAWH